MIVDIYEEGTMDSSSIHRTLDESGDDLGGWKIPLTIPSWMKIGITSFVFKQSFNVLVFCAFVGLLIYFGYRSSYICNIPSSLTLLVCVYTGWLRLNYYLA